MSERILADMDVLQGIPSRAPHIRAVSIGMLRKHLTAGDQKNMQGPFKHPVKLASLVLHQNGLHIPLGHYHPPFFGPHTTASRAPERIFTSFPSLRHLILYVTRHFKSRYISLLSIASPSLDTLDLKESTWGDADSELGTITHPFHSMLPKLKKLHLGTLPVISFRHYDALQDLKENFASRDVWLQWDGCQADCNERNGEGCDGCDEDLEICRFRCGQEGICSGDSSDESSDDLRCALAPDRNQREGADAGSS